MVNNTSVNFANKFVNKDIKYSMPSETRAQIGSVMSMANENHSMNSIMSSGISDSVMSDITGRTKEYKHLIDYGLDAKVANRLDEIFKTGDEISFSIQNMIMGYFKQSPP